MSEHDTISPLPRHAELEAVMRRKLREYNRDEVDAIQAVISSMLDSDERLTRAVAMFATYGWGCAALDMCTEDGDIL